MSRAKRSRDGGQPLAPPALFRATAAPDARAAAWAALSWDARDAWLEAAAAADGAHRAQVPKVEATPPASEESGSDVAYVLTLKVVRQALDTDSALMNKVQAMLACAEDVSEAEGGILALFGVDATLPRSGASRTGAWLSCARGCVLTARSVTARRATRCQPGSSLTCCGHWRAVAGAPTSAVVSRRTWYGAVQNGLRKQLARASSASPRTRFVHPAAAPRRQPRVPQRATTPSPPPSRRHLSQQCNQNGSHPSAYGSARP